MLRIAVLAVLVGLAMSACTGGQVKGTGTISGQPDRPPPLDVSYGDIVRVQAYPVPEGTPPPPLVRDRKDVSYMIPLAVVRSDIPSRFPAPVHCDYSGFGDGLQLTITLRDGRQLNYFACAFPSELKRLYDDAGRR